MAEAGRQAGASRRMALLLAILAAVLAGLIALRLWDIYQGPPATAGAPASATDTQAEAASAEFPTVPAAPPLTTFSEMVERPLFNPERRPQEDEAAPREPEADAAPSQLPDMVLTGIVLSGETQAVLVREPGDKEPRQLVPGDRIDGWTVDRIESDAVHFRQNGRVETLRLRQYPDSGAPPAAPESEARPQRDRPM